MKRRDRVMRSLEFQEERRVPMDLGGMRSTSVSCFVYTALRAHLGLPEGLPMIYDDGQMLAIPEPDVLDALDCDVVFVDGTYSNAFDEKDKFEYYDFNKRLPALVRDRSVYRAEKDGTILRGDQKMAPTGTVFNVEHAGQVFDLENLYMPLLAQFESQMKSMLLTDRRAEEVALLCRKVRESTDRAVFLNSYEMFLDFVGGVANGSMICLMEPEYMHKVNQIRMETYIQNFEKLVPMVRENVDIILSGNNDMGTQNATIASPEILDDIFIRYFKQGNEVIHRLAPGMKTFLHCCGAVYNLMDPIIDAGFDILNPVQWTAGDKTYRQWKDKARNRITLWGGGVDSQHLLPLGSVEEIAGQVREVVSYMKRDGGFVFCNIHNLTAEVSPEKIQAIYEAAKTVV
ncbi:MAG: uroporphyrinogen decarboxylase family protein [Clostridia bacterium]